MTERPSLPQACPDCGSRRRTDNYHRLGWWGYECGRRYSPSLGQWANAPTTGCIARQLAAAEARLAEARRVLERARFRHTQIGNNTISMVFEMRDYDALKRALGDGPVTKFVGQDRSATLVSGKPPVRMFPILLRRDERDVAPAEIPWGLLAGHEQQAQHNHGQSLETLARRGGLSPREAIAVMADKEFEDPELTPADPLDPARKLAALVAWM